MDLAAAGQVIGQVERGAQKAAAVGLRSIADMPPADPIGGMAVVVKAVSVPDRLSEILRSHAWMHAAEGLLYRQAVLAAAQHRGRPTRLSCPCCQQPGQPSQRSARPPGAPGAGSKKTPPAPSSRY